MAKPLPPVEGHVGWGAKLAAGLSGLLHAIALILLLVSGWKIITLYFQLLNGIMLNSIEKMILDYSLTVFAGSAAFLLVYSVKCEEIIKRLLNVKDVQPLKAK